MVTENTCGVELPDTELLKKFDVPAPRYTSYPTADRFHDRVGPDDYVAALQNRDPATGLSLYVHVPFCQDVCFYCACNKIVTRDHTKAESYIDTLCREADLVKEKLTGKTELEQLHWGGGTPTFLSNGQIERLMGEMRSRFGFSETGEFSIEIDPRTCPKDKVETLWKVGFNRMSLGVQDLDENVQQAVNRVQPESMTRELMETARGLGFHSINMDLIYGLPRQTRESFAKTIERVIRLSPDRIALYHYAHLPNHFKVQRRIVPAELPSTVEKVNMMFDAIRALTSNGYRYIGMDHFAKADDELSIAQVNGTIQRNFQGYSTKAECDMVALGASSISWVANNYLCNPREIEPYTEAINAGRLATCRGYKLSAEDVLRRTVIMTIMCRFELVKADIEEQFKIDFDSTFAYELHKLEAYAKHELVTLTPERIVVSPKGKIFVRAVAMQFDWYLRESDRAGGYSKIA